jgi:hypothetical protein
MLKLTIFSALLLVSTTLVVEGFSTSTGTPRRNGASHRTIDTTRSTALYAEKENSNGLFKAGLLANLESEAAQLASKKIRSVKDLGWTKPAKRAGNTRPRHWAFGGAKEKPVQEKPNYDESAPNAVEKWLPLDEFYAILKDDTAVADTIFVSLAGGGAFVERDVAEKVIESWRPAGKFDESAFLKSVQAGRNKFLAGWAVFGGVTGFCVIGIAFPTNPAQMALVDLLDKLLN